MTSFQIFPHACTIANHGKIFVKLTHLLNTKMDAIIETKKRVLLSDVYVQFVSLILSLMNH